MASSTPYIASTIPAKRIRVSNTTLFSIAMRETGDALQWGAIAALNGLSDPWITGLSEILIPPVFPSGVQSGLLDDVDASRAAPPVTVFVPSPVTPPAAIEPSLDFSQPQDSQYLPLI